MPQALVTREPGLPALPLLFIFHLQLICVTYATTVLVRHWAVLYQRIGKNQPQLTGNTARECVMMIHRPFDLHYISYYHTYQVVPSMMHQMRHDVETYSGSVTGAIAVDTFCCEVQYFLPLVALVVPQAVPIHRGQPAHDRSCFHNLPFFRYCLLRSFAYRSLTPAKSSTGWSRNLIAGASKY